MKYRKFGNTGAKVSILGFGAMRLPEIEKEGKFYVEEQKSIELIQKGFDLGINYIDTAYPYCHEQSEAVVGKALKGYRDKVYLSTKMPTWLVKKRGDYRRFLEEQLKKLDVEYIDFYHFHGLNENWFKNVVLKLNLIDEALKAKEEGLIRHISFSFHDSAEVLKEIIDTGVFESFLCQYNIIDTILKKTLAYAVKRGLGISVMGPLGGGRIASFADSSQYKDENIDFISLGLRYVFSNKNIGVALSGMEDIHMLEKNVEAADGDISMTPDESRLVKRIQKDREKLGAIPCTGCNYCMPCPHDVFIPRIFYWYNYLKVSERDFVAKNRYKEIPEISQYLLADSCTECGECLEKCPQKIDIPQRLKECHKALTQED